VESYKEAHVREAIQGLRNIFGGKGAKLVPLAEMVDAVNVPRPSKALLGEVWVRVRVRVRVRIWVRVRFHEQEHLKPWVKSSGGYEHHHNIFAVVIPPCATGRCGAFRDSHMARDPALSNRLGLVSSEGACLAHIGMELAQT